MFTFDRMKYILFFLGALFFISCNRKVETTEVNSQPITESVYASGIVISENQYQLYPNVGGIIDQILVHEGDTVLAGQPLLTIYNEVQKLNLENAELTANFSDANANSGKLSEALLSIELAKDKMLNDSVLYQRQLQLKESGIGIAIELEQSELNYHNSKVAYYNSLTYYNDLKRQINFNSAQSKKNLQISSRYAEDLIVKSRIDGVVYSLLKEEGEMVNQSTPVAIVGNANTFYVELQIDESDIVKIKVGQKVFLSLDSYPNELYDAVIIGVNPILNLSTKTFTATALFMTKPAVLYPNMNVEANIVIMEKEQALLIPRNYLYHDSLVIKSNGDTILVKTGLKDYKMIEITNGLSENDRIQKPEK